MPSFQPSLKQTMPGPQHNMSYILLDIDSYTMYRPPRRLVGSTKIRRISKKHHHRGFPIRHKSAVAWWARITSKRISREKSTTRKRVLKNQMVSKTETRTLNTRLSICFIKFKCDEPQDEQGKKDFDAYGEDAWGFCRWHGEKYLFGRSWGVVVSSWVWFSRLSMKLATSTQKLFGLAYLLGGSSLMGTLVWWVEICYQMVKGHRLE